jgi:hypothetical protein
MEIEELFSKLEKKKVRYLVCGGLAVNIYGIPRMTADIDLLIDLAEDNVREFEIVVNEMGYKPRLPFTLTSTVESGKLEELSKEKNLIAFSYFNSVQNLMSLDVLVDVPFSFEEMWDAREKRKMADHTIHVVSIDHLIEMKRKVGREQDRQDVINLMKFKNEKR